MVGSGVGPRAATGADLIKEDSVSSADVDVTVPGEAPEKPDIVVEPLPEKESA